MAISSPLDLTWAAAFWADQATQVDGQRVASWADSSGNARHAAQATTANQPRLLAGRFNGRNTVRFRGDQFLTTSTFTAVAQPLSVFLVGWIDRSATRFGGTTGSTNGEFGVSSADAYFGSLGTAVIDGARSNDIIRYLLVGNGASSKLRVNGAEVTGNAGTGTVTSLRIGANFNNAGEGRMYGEVAFMGVKAGAFTAQEIADLEAWAQDYYRLSVSTRTTSDAWSWWTRPRAVAINGKTYVGATTSQGDIVVNEHTDPTAAPTARHILATGLTPDDHNNPALVLEPGKAPIVFWQNHGYGSTTDKVKLFYRIGTTAIENGFGSFGATQAVTFPDWVTYSAVHNDGGTLRVVCRVNSYSWHTASSSDWGATWSTPQKLTADPSSLQMYVASRLVGGRIRLAGTRHPDQTGGQSIYYAELDPATGNLYRSDGTTLIGSIGASAVTIDQWEEIGTPATGYKTWVYDISDQPAREVAWMSWNEAVYPSSAMYHHSTKASGSWVRRDVVAAGGTFPDNTSRNYFGGMQYGDNGSVYLAREDVVAADPYADQVKALSPYGYWRLGDASGTTMTDSSGNARNGTYVAGVTLGRAALIDSSDTSALFSTTTGEASVADAAWMDVPTASIIAWGATTRTAINYIAGRWGTSGNHMFLDYQSSNVVRVYANIGGTTRTASATVTGLRDGASHMIVGTYDGATLRLDVDGQTVASVAATGSLVAGAEPFKIGNRGGNTGSFDRFDGRLDEVAFTPPLSLSTVQSLYQLGRSRGSNPLWHLEHRTTTDDGATWQVRSLSESNGYNKLARIWPVERRDNTATAEYAYNEIGYFSTYNDFDTRVLLGGTSVASGPTVDWWDGSTRVAAQLVGWWDGAATQPATLSGRWDGSTVQPTK